MNYLSLTPEEYSIVKMDIDTFFRRPGKQYRSKTITPKAVFIHVWSKRTLDELEAFLQERFEFC